MHVLFVRFVPVMLSGAEEVPCRKPGHLLSHVRADSGRISVMHSAINPGVEYFLQRVGEAIISSDRVDDSHDVAVHRKRDFVGAKKVIQGFCRSAAEAAVGCGVLGMVRRDDESYPRRIRRGFRVAVGIACSNGGNGPPKIVGIQEF